MAADFLPAALDQLELAASRSGLTRARWAELAGLRAETLSRLRARDDCDLRTLTRLAAAANRRLVLVESPDRRMPRSWSREVEGKYAALCASGSTDVARWLAEEPRYFLAGLAMMMASARGVDREAYLALAQALCPAMQDPAEFAEWLQMTPAKPSRFLPMVRSLRAASR